MVELTGMRILIVDDNATNVELLEQVLGQAGYTAVLSTRDATVVRALCAESRPDLLLLDLHMPGLSGYDVMAGIRDLIDPPRSLPVLVLTADSSREARHRALSMGARDFINKPIDPTELLLRAGNLLRTRQLQQQLESRATLLDEAVRIRTVQLEQARLESLVVLATMAEYHDYATANHTQRVGQIASLIAQSLDMPDQFVTTIQDAALLHDVGKVGISDRILLKQGLLTPDERATMMRHVEIGARILGHARSPVLRAAAEIARTHHERWDGQGYLAGLTGEDIPLAGRITAVADVFDALIHERPYKAAWDMDHAVAEIQSQAGRQFDPRVVGAFTAIEPSVLPGPATAHGATANRATANSAPASTPAS
ncbi:MAG TPA: HD domain-containing phosphohydrolase [Solirubrobacteraceae bacterium]|nr:HD domain-containing phosphohydrolase [Solirubrobacteraceae bacterium]